MNKVGFVQNMAVMIIVLAFIMPSAAILADPTRNDCDVNILFDNDMNNLGIYKREHLASVTEKAIGTSKDGIVVFHLDGDDYLPAVTKDFNGHTILTWTHFEDVLSSNIVLAYSDTPSDADSWKVYNVTLPGINCVYMSDIARIKGNEPESYKGLMGVFIDKEHDTLGYYLIPDITDPDTWKFYTWWIPVVDNVNYVQIADDSWYYNKNEDYWGPIYTCILRVLWNDTTPDCPAYIHADLKGQGMLYFDGQRQLLTAPASDPDVVNLEDRFHLVWQYHNTSTEKNMIVWKKVIPTVEPNLEFTPWQCYVADAVHSAIAAYGKYVAVVCEENSQIQCVSGNDDGMNWNVSSIARGTFADIYAEREKLLCTFINDGNLYLVYSYDNGATWTNAEQINDVDGTVVAEEKSVDIHAAGIAWVDDRNGDRDICFYMYPIQYPDKPLPPNGPKVVKVGKEAEFTTTTTDPQGDDIFYMWDWGDGTYSDWIGPFHSGEEASANHTWNQRGKYEIRIKAKDEHGYENPEWSNPNNATVPKSRFSIVPLRPFWFHLMERAADRFPWILEYLFSRSYS